MTEVPPTTFDLIVQGIDAFGEKVRAVPADGWAASTPCTDWSVRDLVNHVTGEHLWAPHMLDGETIAQVGDRYDGDILGDSPVTAWEQAARASRAAWLSTSPDAVVHLSFGDNPALEYGQQMLADLLIHGWDLARGAGLDETMEPAAVALVLAYMDANAKSWEAAGIFAPPVDIDSDEPAKRLIAMSGRQP
jgi:uncharacterized protein (TIGR03086 family)